MDNRHTLFRRVVRGMEVVQTISSIKTNSKKEKPYHYISIVSISVRNTVMLVMFISLNVYK